MEDLIHSWQKLSLSSKEGDQMDLSKNRKIQGFALAAKFFSRRSVNVDAVAQTFRPLWRSSGNFHANDAKNSHVVFTFELEEDVEKVLMGEPWSFDRHLMAFTRYDGSVPVQDLHFDRVSFWSKGLLALEERQFGACLRAPQFNPSRRSYVEVKGFDILDHTRHVLEKEKGPNVGEGRSLISPTGDSDETVTNKDSTVFESHNQVIADFPEIMVGLKASDQGSLISNSNCPTGNIEVSNKEDFSTETTGQSITDLKMNWEVIQEPKDLELITTDKQEFSFEMGWVEKSPMRRGGSTKTRGKEKGKISGPSTFPAQSMLDQDQFLKEGPKRKGDELYEVPTESHIDALVKGGVATDWWHLTGFYGALETSRRDASWALLKVIRDRSTLPWLAIGDFNELVSDSEKEGGSSRPRRHMKNFADTLNWCGLRNMGFVGPRFTWLYQSVNGFQIRERLDRAVASLACCARFKEARVYHLSNSASDHSPLSLHFLLKKKKRYQRKIFRFESMWLKDPKCEDIVKTA
nr:hypothetical protein CFP56_57754 [Quercus suber]